MRVNVTLSKELNEKVDKESKALGMSKSAFMAFIVGSYINDLEVKKSVISGSK